MSAYAPYVPYDYPRVCDICGEVKRISTMCRRGPLTICDGHPGERTKDELSKAIARQPQFRIKPAPNAKPQERDGPDVMEADEGVVLNFIAQQVGAGFQFQDVQSGAGAPIASTAAIVNFLGWAGQYLNDLLVENKRPTSMLVLARALLRSCANQLIAHQMGFGFSPSATKSTDPRWGAVRGTSTSSVTSYEVAYAGLAMLYAYQNLPDIAGTPRVAYLASARAAASYLRNVQALGSVGVLFPSKDAAGLVPLYTGGTQDTVFGSTGAIDGSLSTFSPQGIAPLLLWTELLAADGDQQIGSDAAIAGNFTAAPQQLMSQSITDMRAFWITGTYDAVRGDVRTGLSATTPAEFFNPFPAGTGAWEFSDADAATGTTIRSLAFANAMFVLYEVEGLSAQVTSIDDWLYTFTSNSAYETPTGTSDSALARAQTGTFDPAIAPPTVLLVRDSTAGYAYIAKNGSSLYAWDSMGLMAGIRATRHPGSFKASRLAALGRRQRYADGLPSDAVYDYISLRGRSGLSYQTGFTETILSQSRMVNDGVAAARFGNTFRQQPQVMPVSA